MAADQEDDIWCGSHWDNVQHMRALGRGLKRTGRLDLDAGGCYFSRWWNVSPGGESIRNDTPLKPLSAWLSKIHKHCVRIAWTTVGRDKEREDNSFHVFMLSSKGHRLWTRPNPINTWCMSTTTQEQWPHIFAIGVMLQDAISLMSQPLYRHITNNIHVSHHISSCSHKPKVNTHKNHPE